MSDEDVHCSVALSYLGKPFTVQLRSATGKKLAWPLRSEAVGRVEVVLPALPVNKPQADNLGGDDRINFGYPRLFAIEFEERAAAVRALLAVLGLVDGPLATTARGQVHISPVSSSFR
jgi:hypothetical protein